MKTWLEERYRPIHWLRDEHRIMALLWGEDAVSRYGGNTVVFALYALVPSPADLDRAHLALLTDPDQRAGRFCLPSEKDLHFHFGDLLRSDTDGIERSAVVLERGTVAENRWVTRFLVLLDASKLDLTRADTYRSLADIPKDDEVYGPTAASLGLDHDPRLVSILPSLPTLVLSYLHLYFLDQRPIPWAGDRISMVQTLYVHEKKPDWSHLSPSSHESFMNRFLPASPPGLRQLHLNLVHDNASVITAWPTRQWYFAYEASQTLALDRPSSSFLRLPRLWAELAQLKVHPPLLVLCRGALELIMRARSRTNRCHTDRLTNPQFHCIAPSPLLSFDKEWKITRHCPRRDVSSASPSSCSPGAHTAPESIVPQVRL